jgi:transcriptional regulator with XRE-family HTH domain
MDTVRPLKLRQLQAAMKLKALTLKKVAREARINVSVACQILNGKRHDPLKFEKLSEIIEQAPMPAEPSNL